MTHEIFYQDVKSIRYATPMRDSFPFNYYQRHSLIYTKFPFYVSREKQMHRSLCFSASIEKIRIIEVKCNNKEIA